MIISLVYLKEINAMIRGIATPLAAFLLILVMELITGLFAGHWWYSPAFVLLYVAFFFNAWYDCGRLANITTGIMISAYTLVAIPDQPFRAWVFIIVTMGLAWSDGALKERWKQYAAQLQRAIDENTRHTEEIRRQNQVMAEIAQLGGEVQYNVSRIREARELILEVLGISPNDKLRTALHKLNNVQLSYAGWKALDQAIEQVKSERKIKAEDLLPPMTPAEIEAGPDLPESWQ